MHARVLRWCDAWAVEESDTQQPGRRVYACKVPVVAEDRVGLFKDPRDTYITPEAVETKDRENRVGILTDYSSRTPAWTG